MSQKRKYLVYSYCEDQWQTFVDLVMARDEEHACAMVQRCRHYARVDTAATETVDEHLEYAVKMSKMSPTQVEEAWNQLKKEAY